MTAALSSLVEVMHNCLKSWKVCNSVQHALSRGRRESGGKGGGFHREWHPENVCLLTSVPALSSFPFSYYLHAHQD